MLPSISLLYGSLSIFNTFQLLLCSSGLAISARGGQQLVSVPLTKKDTMSKTTPFNIECNEATQK